MAGRAGRPTRSDAPRGTSRARRSGPSSSTPNRFWNYPRPGYRGLHRWLPSWRFLVSAFTAGVFLVLGVAVAAYARIQVPDPSAQVTDQTTKVYFAPEDGSSDRGALMGTYPGVKREIVDYATLPKYVGQAVVASEDQSFFTNSGVDPRGILRALVNNATGGARQGASTLTQQYVENYYLGATHDYVGKVKEALLAIKIGRTESKDQILGRYLNTIYFGRGAYGIQAAAQAYFGVDAKNLTVSQAAMIAGIIPSPSNWDPAVSPDKAQQRWSRTLDFMVTGGFLSAADRATQQFPQTVVQQQSQTYSGPNGYLLVMARDEVGAALGKTDDGVMRGGYSIITTVKQSIQNEAVRSAGDLIAGKLSKGATPDPNLKIAMVSLDPSTGGILSLYSGQNFLADQINRVTKDQIQAGSTYKPFTLIAALQKGISLSARYSGASPQNIQGWHNDDGTSKVTNFQGESLGTIDLVQATAQSVNTVFAQLNVAVGAKATGDVATAAGVTTPQNDQPSNVLGSDSVKPLDMASAYATIAAQGMYVAPHLVASVLNSTGKVAYSGAGTPARRFDANVMADTTFAMQGPVASSQGSAHTYVAPLKRHIAGKTGTTTNNKAAWFIGFTTNIVTAVAMSQTAPDGKGQDTITPWGARVSQVTGGTWPAALWADYMKPVLAMPAYATDTPFPPRANVGATPTSSAAPTPTATQAPVQTAPATVAVPGGLVGKLEADASAAVLSAGLTPSVTSEASATVPAGRVIRSDPAPGASVATGSGVTLIVSTGPPVVASPTPTPTPTAGKP